AIGKLTVPVAIRQIIDHGIADGFDGPYVYATCGIAAEVVLGVTVLSRIAYTRLVESAQAALYALRVKAFGHVHSLSMAHHDESKRGVLVTRVTSDIETLAQFAQWGAMSWIVNGTIVVFTLAVMA